MARLILLTILFSASLLMARANVEITAKFMKENDNFIYMESDLAVYKLAKKELTPDGIKQIQQFKDKELTIFVPPKSVVKQTRKAKAEEHK